MQTPSLGVPVDPATITGEIDMVVPVGTRNVFIQKPENIAGCRAAIAAIAAVPVDFVEVNLLVTAVTEAGSSMPNQVTIHYTTKVEETPDIPVQVVADSIEKADKNELLTVIN